MSRPSEVALFYHGFETQAFDHPGGRLRSELRRQAREAWRRLKRTQVNTGFYTAFVNLRRSLEAVGVRVRVNDFAFARANPGMPIGISGFEEVYDRIDLPNPAVFGPGFVPDPDRLADRTARCNVKVFTHPSEWPCRLYPSLGAAAQPMFCAVDVADWPDLSRRPDKEFDFILYDKIRWNRKLREAELMVPLRAALDARGLRYRTLRYGAHHMEQYRRALEGSRALLFVCEHETQGLAYQEAMAANIPVLAWDEGVLVDPRERRLAPRGLVVSSVPYFDTRCGLTFRIETMERQLDAFLAQCDAFTPRAYVAEALSPAAGAARFLELLEMARTMP
jgi:glycosyltransferase involved in cell wall biosynthesis